MGQTNGGGKVADRNPRPSGQKRRWRGLMLPSVYKIGSRIRGSRTVSGRAPAVCSRCDGILWRGRIRRASFLVNVRGTRLWLLPGRRCCDKPMAVVVELNYAAIHGDAPPIYPVRSSKDKKGEAANRRNNQASPGAGSGAVTGVAARCGAVITRMTAVRMTAAATIVRIVIVSPAMSHPRNNATAGFTNA